MNQERREVIMKKLMLFSGSAHPELAEQIADKLNIPVSPIKIKQFSDSETYVKIMKKVRGEDVFIIQPTCHPVNDTMIELLIIIDAMKRASAGRINVVIPYYGYARQDRKASAREPISAKLMANLIMTAGANRVVCVDLHADQIQGYFDIPVDHFPCYPLFTEYFKKKNLEDIVIVSSDAGFAKKAKKFSKLMEVPLAIIDKRRPKHNIAEVVFVVGEVKGKTAILVDDMIDTGGTICAGSDALLKMGAKEVYICASHGVLSGTAVERLKNSNVKEIIISDSIPIPEKKRFDKLKIISIAPMMADVIKRIHDHESLGELFYWEAT